MSLSVHYSTIYSSQDMETTWMSTNKGMDKEDVAYFLQWNNSHINGEIVFAATWT